MAAIANQLNERRRPLVEIMRYKTARCSGIFQNGASASLLPSGPLFRGSATSIFLPADVLPLQNQHVPRLPAREQCHPRIPVPSHLPPSTSEPRPLVPFSMHRAT